MSKTPNSNPFKALSALLILATMGAWLTIRVPVSEASQVVDDELLEELRVFTDVLALVQEGYVKKVKGKQLTDGAIRGLLSSLDPHSAYLDPDYFQEVQAQTKGEFGGLGIEIAMKQGMLVVIAPMHGSPAEKAGIRAGDVIVKVDSEYLRNVTLLDVVKRLRGPRGSSVTLSLMQKGKKGKLKEVTVVREKIEIHSVSSRFLEGGFAFIKISQFMESTASDIEKALGNYVKKSGPVRGLILDLRNNPGGLLNQAVKVSDLFLKEGVIVYTKGRIKAQEQWFYAHAADTQPDYPIVVIINGGSASASEIVSAALKDHGRALIIGEQSFGKGSVQTINPLKNGGAVQLTTALYYTKSGRSIQAKGVVPDIILTEKEAQNSNISEISSQVREKNLPGAFQNSSEPNISAKTLMDSNKDSTMKWLDKDPLAKRAVELLKTFTVFGKSVV